MKNLESRLIKFAVGIGISERSAERAVKEAKSKTRDELYSIVTDYSGPIETLETPDETNAHDFLATQRFLEDPAHTASPEIIEGHKRLLMDPTTGLRNKLGYEVAIQELKAKGIGTGYFIYMDGNNMHNHNDTQGSEKVDELLRAAGRAIIGHVRYVNGTSHQGMRKELTCHDVVAHRVNDSGGDEFLLFLPLEHIKESENVVEEIAKRALESIYNSQREILEKAY